MADTLLAALTETSVPDELDYLLWEDNTGPTSNKLSARRLLGLLLRHECKGRLTLTTAVPVTTADVIGASTLYWTPIDGGLVGLYDGTRWWATRQAELSLALSGLTSGKNYDAFISYNAGTPALVLGPAWTNDTTRATGLTTQDGIKVLSGTTTSRYVGTIRTTGTTTTEDSGGVTGTTQVGGKRFVWNAYNRVLKPISVSDLTDNWSYTTASFRQANGAAGNQVEYVCGEAGEEVDVSLLSCAFSASTSVQPANAVGVDSTTVGGGFRSQNTLATAASNVVTLNVRYVAAMALGYHYLAWLEYGGDTTCLFLGDGGGTLIKTGLTGSVRC